MSRIGFIGLGIMGSPMAANLVRARAQGYGSEDHSALLKVIENLSRSNEV
jgi:3-hydroxyisobutyrate dehydrogenase-like beta-hydroxyacid dehydrogenase